MAKKKIFPKTIASAVDVLGKSLLEWLGAKGGIATLGEDGRLEKDQQPISVVSVSSGDFSGDIDTGITLVGESVYRLTSGTKGTFPKGLPTLSESILYHNNYENKGASQLLFAYSPGDYRGMYYRQKSDGIWGSWNSPLRYRHEGRIPFHGRLAGDQSSYGSTSESGAMKDVRKSLGGVYFWQMPSNTEGDDDITPSFGLGGIPIWYHGIRFQHPGYTQGYWVDVSISFDGVPFIRTNKNGNISSWKRLSTLENPISLVSGIDLDTLHSDNSLGVYWTAQAAILNKPEGVVSFCLEVFKLSNNYVGQRLTAVKGTTGTREGVFYRYYNGSAWSQWDPTGGLVRGSVTADKFDSQVQGAMSKYKVYLSSVSYRQDGSSSLYLELANVVCHITDACGITTVMTLNNAAFSNLGPGYSYDTVVLDWSDQRLKEAKFDARTPLPATQIPVIYVVSELGSLKPASSFYSVILNLTAFA